MGVQKTLLKKYQEKGRKEYKKAEVKFYKGGERRKKRKRRKESKEKIKGSSITIQIEN